MHCDRTTSGYNYFSLKWHYETKALWYNDIMIVWHKGIRIKLTFFDVYNVVDVSNVVDVFNVVDVVDVFDVFVGVDVFYVSEWQSVF